MLKIGMIGAGNRGKAHINNWKSVPGVEIVGFYEPDDDIANEVSERFQIPRFLYTDILIDACDAIDLTTPIASRSGCCEKAIRSGKHVLVTSPFAYTVDEARQIVKLVEESGIKLQVECTERFNPAVLAIKDMALNPSLIEINHLISLDDSSAQKDIVLDVMAGDIDLILNIVRSDVKNISCAGVAVVTDAPDIVNIRMEFHNGCVANFTCNRVSARNSNTINIFQQDSYIGIDLLNKKTEVIKLKESKEPNVFTTDIDTGSDIRTIATDQLFVEDVNELKAELEDFKTAILTNTKPVISETDGLTSLDIARRVMEKVGSNPVIK